MTRILAEGVVALSASTELLMIFKATIALSIALIAVWVTRSSRASVRHLLLTPAFAVLLLLPLATAVVPALRFSIPVTGAADSAGAPQNAQSQHASDRRESAPPAVISSEPPAQISTRTLLWAIWAIGAAWFLGRMVLAVCRLRQLQRTGIPWVQGQAILQSFTNKQTGRVTVLLHDDVSVPVTAGFVRPAILLPGDASEWAQADICRTLMHELEHVRRGDWIVHIIARAACACYWFHPLVWIAWRKFCVEAERACDDAVVLRAERADYAEQLVTMARRLSNALAPPVLSMANRSDLSTRVSAILDRNQRRGRAGLLYISSTVLAGTLFLFAIAPLRAVALSSNADEPSSLQQQSQTVKSALSKALLEAAESGRGEEVAKLLDSGADVNATFAGDGTALIVAASEGHIAVVQFLLDHGADPDLAVSGDGNALIMSAREGHVAIVKLLLDRGAAIDRVVPGDENALIQASAEGQISVVKLLVSRGADVNVRVWVSRDQSETAGEWRTPLSMARKGGHGAVIEFLLANGARE
jgi:beta-lactamase regulating signal transducer with metallopeptidase domain